MGFLVFFMENQSGFFEDVCVDRSADSEHALVKFFQGFVVYSESDGVFIAYCCFRGTCVDKKFDCGVKVQGFRFENCIDVCRFENSWLEEKGNPQTSARLLE